MKFHFSSSRGETKNNFSSRISRDRDSCQGLDKDNDQEKDNDNDKDKEKDKDKDESAENLNICYIFEKLRILDNVQLCETQI